MVIKKVKCIDNRGIENFLELYEVYQVLQEYGAGYTLFSRTTASGTTFAKAGMIFAKDSISNHSSRARYSSETTA